MNNIAGFTLEVGKLLLFAFVALALISLIAALFTGFGGGRPKRQT
jgi:hypothetical protein